MTGSATQAALDVADLLWQGDRDAEQASIVSARLARALAAILWFVGGCAGAALLYAWVGFWCLAVPVVVALVTVLTGTND